VAAGRDPLTRADVVAAGHLGDETTARAGLDASDAGVRASALGALDRLGVLDDATVVRGLRDPEPQVRRRALAAAASRPAVDLVLLLSDVDASVVEQAAWACGEQETVSDDVLERLIALVGSHDDALVREAAVAALGAIGDERAVAAIVGACSDKPAVRRRAVLALAPFAGPAVDAALQTALTDRDWQVRQAAEDLLEA
jgi:HEAT repeat protein